MKERHIDNRLLQFSCACIHAVSYQDESKGSLDYWDTLVKNFFEELLTNYPNALDPEVIERKATKLERFTKRKGTIPYWAYSQYYKDELLSGCAQRKRSGITIGHCNYDYLYHKELNPVFVTVTKSNTRGKIFCQQQGIYNYDREQNLLCGKINHYADAYKDGFFLFTTNEPTSIQLKKIK